VKKIRRGTRRRTSTPLHLFTSPPHLLSPFPKTQMSPQGCYLPTVYQGKTACSFIPNAKWHELASSKEQCVSEKGCSSYFQVRALSPLTSKACKNCGKNTKNYYRWTSAKVGLLPSFLLLFNILTSVISSKVGTCNTTHTRMA
jgi:hypothetical protein